MVLGGYAGIGVGALLLAIAISSGSIFLGVLGALILLAFGWGTRAVRDL
jgi:hypothetical protein